MIKSKKQMFIIIGVFTLVMLLGTVTFAFFNYTRTGASNNIKVGRISFVSKDEETINLSNLFPIDPTEQGIMNDNTKVGTYQITIEGDTDYSGGIEYLVSTVNSNLSNLPISINMTVGSGLGTSDTNYFTTRDTATTPIYKKIVGSEIVGDQMLLVGFIPQNTTLGTSDETGDTITIKAYLDKNKILISDTYDGTESDNMGTPNSLAEGKTVLTTTEWNALSSTGVSFKIKVEANEGIWVKRSLDDIIRVKNISTTTNQPIMDNEQSEFVSASTGIDFGAISSDTNGKGVYMRAGTQNDAYPIVYYRGAVEDNNVLFNNKCWKAVRTTDTGGVKLIYNGENTGTEEEPNCDNTGTDTHISLSETNTFSFNTGYNSLAYVGYMYGEAYPYEWSNWQNGARFGSSFTWDGTKYKLVDAETTIPDATHHYSCNSTDAEATCTDIRYVYYTYYDSKYYITLTGGDGIAQAIDKMHTNRINSNAKTQIDTWYADNMTSVTNKLEDTIWCNDRSIGRYNGWNSTGSWGENYEDFSIIYQARERSNDASSVSNEKNRPNLACVNRNDAFTVNNGKGNKSLTYPVAMLTEDEMVLAGGLSNARVSTSSTFYLNNGKYYWSLTPSYFRDNPFVFMVSEDTIGTNDVRVKNGLRPAISIKPGMPVVSGDGTSTSPYVIE